MTAEITRPVRLADGTRGTLRAWWDGAHSIGGYAVIAGDGRVVKARGDMGSYAWQDEMRAILARGESDSPAVRAWDANWMATVAGIPAGED